MARSEKRTKRSEAWERIDEGNQDTDGEGEIRATLELK